jgi:hypothetical protein
MIRYEFLQNDPFKVNNLVEYLNTKRGLLTDQNADFFRRKAKVVTKTLVQSSGSCHKSTGRERERERETERDLLTYTNKHLFKS